MKAAIQVFLIATGSSLVHPNAVAQPKPLSLAYQDVNYLKVTLIRHGTQRVELLNLAGLRMVRG